MVILGAAKHENGHENGIGMDDKATSFSSVFEKGDLSVKTIKLNQSDASGLPKSLLIVSPIEQDTYPLILFCHGFCINNAWYSQLLQNISSHGYIIVAPDQFYSNMLVSVNDDIDTAAKVTDWLPKGLQSVLPEKVHADLNKLALIGHSRGGKTAFALALGHASTTLKFSALIGIDPVAGSSPSWRFEPKILTYVPRSFDLSIPVAVIGTGLGNQAQCLIPPLSPDGVNHVEFFNECKPPCCYFIASDYGHCDILDDGIASLASWVCSSGKGSKDLMRRGVAGIVVAFLKAYLGDDDEDLQAIVDGRLVPPITLDPIKWIKD